MVVGLIEPDKGEVFFDNQLVCSQTFSSVRQRIGYVIQEGGLFPHLTAEQNILLMARLRGWKDSKQKERVSELSELTHISSHLLSKYPHELSGGQRQRIGLIRALMLSPECLLLDEPLGALDPMIRSDLQIDLKTICKSQERTVVLVTHDLGEAFFFGDWIVLLKGGAIAQMGTALDLIQNPANDFVRQFINAQRPPLPEDLIRGQQ